MIELNGIANMKIVLDMKYDDKEIDSKTYHMLCEELELLNRYMMALGDNLDPNKKVPFWHEVRENPEKYPTNKERFANQK